MSKRSLGILKATGLLNEKSQPVIDSIPDADLLGKLQYYRNFRERSFNHEINEYAADTHTIAALFGSRSASVSITDVLPSALLYDRIFIDDHLFNAIRREEREIDVINKRLMGFAGTTPLPPIDRTRISQ